MPLQLFLDLHSQPCRSVFLFAKVNNIPFEFKKVDLTAGQQYSDEFGKISIIRKVPVMRDGDFILTESVAILMYMVQKFGTPDHWYPADLRKRAQVNEYLSWQHMAMRLHASKVFWFRAMVPLITGAEVPKEKMDSAMEDLNSSLKFFEEKFLQDRPFIIGEKISLADLVAIVEIVQPVGTGLDVFKDRPKLSAWRERVKKELGPAVFDEAHEVIANVHNLRQAFEKNGMLELFKTKLQKLFN
ncbi:Glutathione S-transferase theta-1-like [Scleropages formosus]|uniref:glutathione transferase n=1 Tax=Scleropages formosus TaxID=113540 RepID=A0A0P7UP47_SCLFO|nr:glutathione S-transferase theta-1-like [Scleropages formosus]KPP70784.1 Glutathione S-transferase theta-1-like [Scleropages formosus]